MTTRKKTAEVDQETPLESEVKAENTNERTFTAEIGGEERTFTDMTGDTVPPAAMFLGNATMANKYAPILLDQVLGYVQLADLLAEGCSQSDMQNILKAWVKSRNLGN